MGKANTKVRRCLYENVVTQKELAEVLNVTQGTVYNWLKDEMPMRKQEVICQIIEKYRDGDRPGAESLGLEMKMMKFGESDERRRQTSMCITPTAKSALKRAAEKLNASMSAVLDAAIKEYVSNHNL